MCWQKVFLWRGNFSCGIIHMDSVRGKFCMGKFFTGVFGWENVWGRGNVRQGVCADLMQYHKGRRPAVMIWATLLYGLPAWGPLLDMESMSRIDSFLKRCHHYCLASKLISIQPLFDSVMKQLFDKMQSPLHCLYPAQTRTWTTNFSKEDISMNSQHARIITTKIVCC